jgi:hypothetical protein
VQKGIAISMNVEQLNSVILNEKYFLNRIEIETKGLATYRHLSFVQQKAM